MGESERAYGFGSLGDLQSGDVVLTRLPGGGLLTKLILLSTRMPGEPKTVAGHVGMIYKAYDDTTDDAYIIEQTSPLVRVAPMLVYVPKQIVIIARNNELEDDVQAKLIETAQKDIGKQYGFLKLPLFFLDWLTFYPINLIKLLFHKLTKPKREYKPVQKPIFARVNLTGNLVCSQFLAAWYESCAKVDFGGDPITRTPDDIYDYIEQQIGKDGWELVYCHIPDAKLLPGWIKKRMKKAKGAIAKQCFSTPIKQKLI